MNMIPSTKSAEHSHNTNIWVQTLQKVKLDYCQFFLLYENSPTQTFLIATY